MINWAALAGHYSNFINSYGIGFSLLLAPFFIVDNIIEPYRFAILLNALCLGGIFLTFVHLSKVEGAKYPILTGLVISAYPTLWLYGNNAIPEILITLILILMYLKISSYQKNHYGKDLLSFAGLGACIVILHPRMVELFKNITTNPVLWPR